MGDANKVEDETLQDPDNARHAGTSCAGLRDYVDDGLLIFTIASAWADGVQLSANRSRH